MNANEPSRPVAENGGVNRRSHATPPEHRSEDLLQDCRHADIVHRGQRYILRETRSGKLILYK